jgi:hypothetical protein
MKKSNVTSNQQAKQKHPASKTASSLVLGSLAAAMLPLAASPANAADAAAATAPPPPPSRVDALYSVQFASEYVTPRGMIVRDQGLTIQPLFLGFINLYKGDSFINSFTLIPGVWNDLGTATTPGNTGQSPTHWTEIDPIAGVEVGFAKNFTLDVTYTEFVEQILNIGTSQHLDTKLSFNDSSYLGAFALHPYVEYWQELQGKSTAADVPYIVNPLGKANPGPGPGSSYYFEAGVAPSYTFKDIGLKVELPCRMLLPNKNFYGTYYAGNSTVGLYEVGLKGTIPMNFMPGGYGHWSFDAGVKYLGFMDKNLADMQQFNSPGKSVSGTTQFYCGISTFF